MTACCVLLIVSKSNRNKHLLKNSADAAFEEAARMAELPSADFMAQYGGSPETYIERASLDPSDSLGL